MNSANDLWTSVKETQQQRINVVNSLKYRYQQDRFLGMKESEIDFLVDMMLKAIEKRSDEKAIAALHKETIAFCRSFPIPGVEKV